jgi:hypothetical protein
MANKEKYNLGCDNAIIYGKNQCGQEKSFVANICIN